MNGSQSLIRSLVAAGVDICFMNPGTSEMHFVRALDDVPEMRGVLGLFEGVAMLLISTAALGLNRNRPEVTTSSPGLSTSVTAI